MIIRCGIDPGKEGAIVWFENGLLHKSLIPKISKEVDTLALDRLFKTMLDKATDLHIVMEATNPFFGASSKSMYSFGHTIGCTEQAIVSNRISFTKAQPKAWQEEMFQGVPKQWILKPGNKKKTHDTKATALIAAKRLFPSFDLTKSKRAKTPHDGIVDALLIAEYCRRHF